jgi:dUTPase
MVQKGDRIAQLVVYPIIEPEISWTDEIHETNRGEKGLGSSGK